MGDPLTCLDFLIHVELRISGNLADTRAKISSWRDEYNGERPHSSLGYRTPNEFAETLTTKVENRFEFPDLLCLIPIPDLHGRFEERCRDKGTLVTSR